jgi:hypothetical protein
MGRDNQAAVTKSVLHKVTVVALTVYVDADTHTHVPPQRIIIKKVNQSMQMQIHAHTYTLAKYLQSANGCSA